jgi:hypothetical protein
MADTMVQSAPATRSAAAALAILVLALAPQIFELAWSLGTVLGLGNGRSPIQVLLGQGTALVMTPVVLAQFITARLSGFSSDLLLAMIYSWPLIAIAVATRFVPQRAPRDYVGGIVLVAVALFALWASSDLQGMRGFSFGAGTAPRMFCVLLLLMGAAIAITGVLADGATLEHLSWRGPLFVMLAILCFALAIRPLGLVVSGFASFMIAALGTSETRWVEAIIVGACLTVGCALLFPYVLGLPMPLFPRFLIQ